MHSVFMDAINIGVSHNVANSNYSSWDEVTQIIFYLELLIVVEGSFENDVQIGRITAVLRALLGNGFTKAMKFNLRIHPSRMSCRGLI